MTVALLYYISELQQTIHNVHRAIKWGKDSENVARVAYEKYTYVCMHNIGHI